MISIASLDQKLAHLNPDRIYLENVRSLLGVSATAAKRICDTAVRQGLFNVGIQVLCPDGSVAMSLNTDDEKEIPLTIHCWEERNGDLVETELPTKGLRKLIFYSLKNERSRELFTRSA
jgi:hypothetical protein